MLSKTNISKDEAKALKELKGQAQAHYYSRQGAGHGCAQQTGLHKQSGKPMRAM